MALTRRPAADDDLLAIWAHIAAENDHAADRLMDRIDAALIMLSENPLAGRARPELGSGIRSFVVGQYVLIYAATGGGVELYRVRHGARDMSAMPLVP